MGTTSTADPGIAGSAYAIFQDSGRQYRASEGDELLIDRRKGVQPGDPVVFDRVLLVRGSDGVRLGTPVLDGAKVQAEVIGEELGKKIIVFKFRRRKDSRVKRGHRARYTRVKVSKIEA